jgi:multidrug efflux pump subunit AcrB
MFAVSTNIIAFLPLLFVPGESGRFFQVLPAVVIAVFTVSLVECLLILPAHLAVTRRSNGASWFARFDRAQTRLRLRLDGWMERLYGPVLGLATRFAAVTVAVFVSVLAMVAAYVASGRVPFTFRPSIETDFIQAEIEMPSGTPVARTREVAFQIEAAARRALELTGEKDIMVGVFTTVADRSSHGAEVSMVLVPQSG